MGINVVGVKESAGLNIALAVVDFLTQVLLVVVGAVLVLGANPGQLAASTTDTRTGAACATPPGSDHLST